MIDLKKLEEFKNDMNEIKKKCIEILKFKKERDKYDLLKINEDILSSDAHNIDNIDIENNELYITMNFYYYGEFCENNYMVSFEELIDENWKDKFLKELNKLEIEYLFKRESEEVEKLEKLLLKEKEEYKRLRKKFEDFYEKNNSNKI